ncbi:hypothetical protein [Craterilacuibacter sinensis]|uniref:hypothetical protein n=1 Tax=Craterilacuibacter sinensis TaxID=2686017 RepID=UPI001F3B9C54|nr:hypothetical protein [Craterilacuibacter sinensis]
MVIYLYHADNGTLLGESVAHESPREPGVFLLPAFATFDAPPSIGEREAAVFADGAWATVPDWRGVALWSTASGAPLVIGEPGVTPVDVAATDIAPPGPEFLWDGARWLIDAGRRMQLLIALQERRAAEVNANASGRLATLSAAYPDGEVQSWGQQTREAEALAVNPSAPAPLLTAIASARGLPLADLAARVREKVQAYAVASGQIIGQRQALEDAIHAVDLAAPDAAAQLEAIKWPA